MKKIVFIKFSFLLLLSSVILNAQPEFSQIAGKAGAFSRMGFGARGIGMGNALSSVRTGNLSAYYNPALSVFQEGNNFQTGYSFLSLDHSLNFLNFTKRFEFGKKNENSKPASVAGMSAGIMNSGVSDIDGRDNQGIHTENLSTSENQFYLAVANRFSEKLALGLNIKFYYYKLYEEITSTAIGFDLGVVYSYNSNLAFSFVLTDINSKYKWDTTPVYEQAGTNSTDTFPLLKKIGASYYFDDVKLLTALEYENSNAGTNYLRGGIEYEVFENLFIRSGFDKLDFSNFDVPAIPSFGFSYFYTSSSVIIGAEYAFAIEPYSSSDRHIIGLNFNF
ncbi:MAG: hypothetical protein PHW27_04435 [Melioribacteraceae bacterium]|nr:hypothetical protein [Melioribacteraceae bacterium]